MKNIVPTLFIMGPTGAGKTALAIELAQHLPVELISVDSAMVYKDMDIGTAKPDYPHHLIDIITPIEAYSAAKFREDALNLIDNIYQKGKIPLLVGGTMLYFNKLEKGLSDLPSANAKIRERLLEKAKTQGWQSLHQELATIDPESAQKIHPNDPQRLQRALEIFYITGKTLTELYQQPVEDSLDFPVIKIALYPQTRANLHNLLAQRLETMLAQGFIEEVEKIREIYPDLTIEMPSMRCVGYRQIWDYLEGSLEKALLFDKMLYATRQFAKRQFTWLRSTTIDYYFDPFELTITTISQNILKLLKMF